MQYDATIQWGTSRGRELDKLGMPLFVAGINEYLAGVRAMRQHGSQLVWFRWLYVSFSRYMWVNQWAEVKFEE